MAVIETVFAMMMIVNGLMDGFMKTDGLAHCLKVKRESERNLSDSRSNVIRYEMWSSSSRARTRLRRRAQNKKDCRT